MRRTDGVAAHLLHHLNLSDEGRLVDGSAKRSEVVVQTDALDLASDTVELEAALLRYADGADAELLADLVEGLTVLHILDVRRVEIRCLRRPEIGVADGEGEFRVLAVVVGFDVLMSDELALGIAQLHLEGLIVVVGVAAAHCHLQRGLAVAEVCGAYEGLPGVYPVLTRYDELHGAVDASARIPTRTLLHVLQIHFEQVVARLHRGCQIHAEGIVAVGPVADLLTVQADGGLCHRTVEHEFGMLTVVRDRDDTLVVAFADPGQCT